MFSDISLKMTREESGRRGFDQKAGGVREGPGRQNPWGMLCLCVCVFLGAWLSAFRLCLLALSASPRPGRRFVLASCPSSTLRGWTQRCPSCLDRQPKSSCPARLLVWLFWLL